MNNITLAIPPGKDLSSRLDKEISAAKNIKDNSKRVSILTGLNRIKSNLSDGTVYIWNGEELWSHEYPYHEFIYHCGKGFQPCSLDTENRYLLVTLDTRDAAIGLLSGKKIDVLWSKSSNIPGKHGAGGQSKKRYLRHRTLLVKMWYKEICEKIKEIALKK